MGRCTKHAISEETQNLVAAAGSGEPQPPPSKTAEGQSTTANVHAPVYEVFPSCPELMTLKEETKQTEAFFGSQTTLQINQYTLRHKTGYIKIEDGQVGYIYPIRASQVHIRTAPREPDQLVQWRVEYRYCLQGSLLFKPAQDQADYVMFLFEKTD